MNKTKTIMAIDPGKNGGIAWSEKGLSVVNSIAMPKTPSDILGVLEKVKPDFILIEKVTGYIAGQRCPSSYMFNFGYGVGILHGLITALRIPFDEIRPQAWQKSLRLGTRPKEMSKPEWKNKLKKKAEMLFPKQKVTLKNADALLILRVAMKGEW